MSRQTVTGILVIGLITAAAFFVTAPLTATGAPASHYSHAAGDKPHHLKGSMAKNCLDTCVAIVW